MARNSFLELWSYVLYVSAFCDLPSLRNESYCMYAAGPLVLDQTPLVQLQTGVPLLTARWVGWTSDMEIIVLLTHCPRLCTTCYPAQ